MKILVLSNLYPPDVIGGYELGCRQAVDALRSQGHEVLVLTTVPRIPAANPPHVRRELHFNDLWNPYVFQHNSPVTSHLTAVRSGGVDAHNVHVLARVIEEFQPDVAYVWMIVGVGGLGLLATLQHMEIPWLWHLMDDVPLMLCRYNNRLVPELVDELRRQMRGRFVSCSRQLVDEIESGGLHLGHSVEVIPNWIVGEAIDPPRSDYYTPGCGRPLRIVNAGQISRHKGVDLLIESAARLRHAGYEDFRIDFFGNDSDAYFASLVRYFGLDRHIRFMGSRPQQELAGLYRDYDLFAFPTWAREPFGFAPMEAATSGCVSLMSQLCGKAEWFVHGVHCIKVERTPESFARGIASIMDGEIDLEPIAVRQARVVLRDFHIDAIIPRIEAALVRASELPRGTPGSAEEAYRLAILGEKLIQVMVQENLARAGAA